jgi:cation diffusion facilitator family transporter
MPVPDVPMPRSNLTGYAWLSVAAALLTIALKTTAYLLTSSVGLLSDALESLVNLVAAGVLVVVLRIAAAPPDAEHEFGHGKAEYFSSGLEGALVFVAAAAIVASALPRLWSPVPLDDVGLGLVVSAIAGAVNLFVALRLRSAAKKHHSISLEADAHHLLTDVWTSAGVIAGVGLVALTGWERFDPILALGVAAHILWMGGRLIRRSVMGLLDAAVPEAERAELVEILGRYERAEGMHWHALRTRQAGARRFVTVHVLVPGAWTVQRGHDLCERIEHELAATRPMTSVFTHLEPVEDERSFADQGLDRPPL